MISTWPPSNLDPGIKKEVEILYNFGFDVVSSCEGRKLSKAYIDIAILSKQKFIKFILSIFGKRHVINWIKFEGNNFTDGRFIIHNGIVYVEVDYDVTNDFCSSLICRPKLDKWQIYRIEMNWWGKTFVKIISLL